MRRTTKKAFDKKCFEQQLYKLHRAAWFQLINRIRNHIFLFFNKNKVFEFAYIRM